MAGIWDEPACPLFNAPLVRQSCTTRYRQERPDRLMALPDSLHSAVKTLTSALDLLEAAVERRSQAEAARADREQELALMQEDRARLGEELECSEQANNRLHTAGVALSERLAHMDVLCAALRQRATD